MYRKAASVGGRDAGGDDFLARFSPLRARLLPLHGRPGTSPCTVPFAVARGPGGADGQRRDGREEAGALGTSVRKTAVEYMGICGLLRSFC